LFFSAASLAILSFAASAYGLHLSPGDLDPLDTIDEDDFEEIFHVTPSANLSEEIIHEEVLEENEALIQDINEAYLAGNKTWFDAVNEFSNLPVDEFEQEKTGLINRQKGYGRGFLAPRPEDRIDEASEKYFDQFRYGRASPPDSYNSVELGMEYKQNIL